MPEILEDRLQRLGEAWRGGVPDTLRARTAEIAARASGTILTTVPVAPLGDWRRPALRTGAALVSATAILVLLFPGARLVVARQADWLLQVLQISPSTELHTSGVRGRDEVNASLQQHHEDVSAGRGWFVSTVYGGIGGSVPKGARPEVRRVDQPDVLATLAPMPLLAPYGVHRGVSTPFTYAWLTPDGVVLAFFGFDDAEVFLIQAPVGNGQRMAYSRSIGGAGTSVGVAPSIEALTINGQQLTWDPDTTGIMPNSAALRWEASGVSYSLYGRGLTRDEAVRLFSNLRPLQ
jgi:hypothetical protein